MTPHKKRDDRRGEENFVVLKIAWLNVDRSYQRRYDHNMAHSILARNGGVFDMVWAGPILVNRRLDGSYWVIDGQHRTGMATEAGEKEILAELLVGLSVTEEAALRVARHARKADTALEKFHARVSAGDRAARAIMKIAADHGASIAEDNTAPVSHLRAVKAMERIYEVDRGKRLSKVLRIIKNAYDTPTRDTASSYTLLAISYLLERHDHEIDVMKLERRLRVRGLKWIDSRARVISVAGGSMWKNYYRAMLEVYNARTAKAEHVIPRNA